MSPLEQIQHWYANNCNGLWEHSYGVRIDTLDNPGWELSVDLADTPWASLNVPRARKERSETDWIDFRVSDSKFLGYGGPLNLEELIEVFLELVSRNSPHRTAV